MKSTPVESPLDSEFRLLETQVDNLLKVCKALREENRALREQQANTMAERARLIEKNDIARNRVDAIVSRLRSMERTP